MLLYIYFIPYEIIRVWKNTRYNVCSDKINSAKKNKLRFQFNYESYNKGKCFWNFNIIFYQNGLRDEIFNSGLDRKSRGLGSENSEKSRVHKLKHSKIPGIEIDIWKSRKSRKNPKWKIPKSSGSASNFSGYPEYPKRWRPGAKIPNNI